MALAEHMPHMHTDIHEAENTASTSTSSPPPETTANGESNETTTVYRCSTCAVTWSSLEELQRHTLDSGHLSSEDGGYYCPQDECRQFFNTNLAAMQHYRAMHGGTDEGVESDKHEYRYRCNQCPMAFRTQEKLNGHALYHLMRANTRCAICDRNFRSTQALRKHVENEHAGDESSGQESTSEVSPTQNNANQAKYLDPTRPFKCDVCKESFTQKNILQVHFNSVGHLNNAKRLLESKKVHRAVDLS